MSTIFSQGDIHILFGATLVTTSQEGNCGLSALLGQSSAQRSLLTICFLSRRGHENQTEKITPMDIFDKIMSKHLYLNLYTPTYYSGQSTADGKSKWGKLEN